MNKRIRWGILGCGKIARKFAADLTLAQDAELVAVASRDIDVARQFAADFPVRHIHGSYQSLVLNEDVDVIYVATPHSHHYEHSLLCLHHGKAVLCEKSFAVNLEQSRRMIAVAREKKLFIMEAMWTKFLPHYQRLKALLAEGLIGDIRSVLIEFGFRPSQPVAPRLFDPQLAGGTMLDIGVYNVFIAMEVLGKPDFIDAHMTPAESGVDEQCAVLFRYKNGAIAQLFSSFSSHLPTEAEIAGTRGRLKLSHRFYAHESDIEYYSGRPDTRQILPVKRDPTGSGYQYQIRHVCSCIREGRIESPVVSHQETLERMEVLDKIRQKAGIVYREDSPAEQE